MAKQQAIGVVYVHVEPEAKGFGKTIEGDVDKAIEAASKKSSTTLISKIGGALGKVGRIGATTIAGLTTGIAALTAKGGFERALNIENAQAKLTGLGHDSASVTEIMNDALASVKGTAFGLGDAATVAASLSASGVAEGEQLTSVLKTVADTAQISGRSLTDVGTIFGSVAARGKLQGDDMLQLMSSGIPVLQMLATHLGKTSAEISDMVSEGQIDFQTFADAMQEGMGGAAQSAGTTFTGALANVKAALSRLGETAATPVLNGLRGLFNQAIPVIDQFTATVTPTLERVGSTIQKGLEQAIPTIQSFFTQLGQNQTVQQLAESFATLAGKAGGFATALAGMASSVWGELSAQLSDVSGLLPGLVDLFGTLLDTLSGVLGYVAANASTLVPLVEGVGALVLAGKGIGAVTGGLKAVASTAAGVEKTATAAFDLVSKLTEASSIAGGLKQLAGSLNIVKAAQSAWTAVTKAATAVQLAFNLAMEANPFLLVVTLIAALVAALTLFFTQTEIGRQLWASFTSFLSSAWQATVDTVTSIGQSIVAFFTSTLPSAIQGVGQWFQQLPETIAYWLGYAVATIVTYAAMIGVQALQMGMQFVQNIGTFLIQLPGNVASWLAGAVASASAWVDNMASQAMQAGSRFLTNVGTFLTQLPARVGTWLSATISGVANWASQMGAKAFQAGQQFVQNIVSTLSGLPGRMLSIGADIVNGIVDGIQSKIGSIASSLLSGVNDAISAVKSKLGIHSPSRLMRDQVGVMVGRGMALGIDDSAAVVNKSMDSLVSSMGLDDTDWSKTGRLNVTAGTPSESDRIWESIINRLDTLIEAVETATADDRPFTQRDFARLVRSLS